MSKVPLRMPVTTDPAFDYREFDITGYGQPTNQHIDGIETVYKTTGFDNFGNSEVLKVLLDSSRYRGQSELTMWMLVHGKQPDSWYEVQVSFYDLEMEKLELWDFNMQNVISELRAKKLDDGNLAVLLASKFGCGFKLTCKRAKVEGIQPTTYRGGLRVEPTHAKEST